MFGLFKKKQAAPSPIDSEPRIWLTDAARQRGVLADATAALEGGACVVIAAWSASVLAELQRAIQEPKVAVLAAETLTPAAVAAQAQGAKSMRLLFAGLGPVVGESVLIQQCRALPFELQVQSHLSLDELEALGVVNAGTRKMLHTLGMSPDEPLAHPYVTRAIATARSKLRR